MSIFSRILEKLTGHAQAAPTGQPAPTTQAGPAMAPPQSPGPADDLPATAPIAQVDVAAILTGLAQQSRQKLDWRHSIVDMMKLLELDSSLEARKSLAQELHYTGDTNDSAAMNTWLHQQVMQKLADNGGKVPADLRN